MSKKKEEQIVIKKLKGSNKKLHRAKDKKDDEFYTRYDDIQKELRSDEYRKQLKDKIIYCNCDDAKHSQFWIYFIGFYDVLKLKGLITTYYPKNGEPAYSLKINDEVINDLMKKHKLTREQLFEKFIDKNEDFFPEREEIKGDEKYGAGDFRSKACIELLEEAHVVITNPPFSVFREFVAQLIEYDKKFLIIGNKNSVNCKEIFPLLKNKKMWVGFTQPSGFLRPDNSIKKVGAWWFTNLKNKKKNDGVGLYKLYKGNEANYPKYDNYDGINVNKTEEIPKDYFGVMGVPLTIFIKHDPKQFQIVGFRKGSNGKDLTINGKDIYCRILIKRVDNE
ncbi:MAG: adenine-specific methyltransferase EcoRI family protein [Mycoplasmoidaceae bacterium]